MGIITPKFGVEIEFLSNSADMESIASQLRDRGFNAVAESYNHKVRDHWKVTTDSSCGLELVSPPMEWHQRTSLREVMLCLQEAGCTVTRDCGFHVHHEWPWRDHLARNADKDERLLLIRTTYRKCEPLLRVLLSATRWENRYCLWKVPANGGDYCSECDSTSCGWCEGCMSHTGGNCACERSEAEDLHNNRYQAVNYVCLQRQPTVEFRQFQGTLNPTKAVAWIEFTRNIVHAASRPDMDEAERMAFIFDKLSFSTRRFFVERCIEKDTDFDTVLSEVLL